MDINVELEKLGFKQIINFLHKMGEFLFDARCYLLKD
jgi:hypothetical protein